MNLPDKFELVTWPDKVLEQQCEEIPSADIGSEELERLFVGMERIMFNHDGYGLAAPQVGVLAQAIIMRIPGDNILRLINPILSKGVGPAIKTQEGCLSYPNVKGNLNCRFEEVKVTFQNDKGGVESAPFRQLAAIVFQHEYDHLQGQTILSRMGRMQRISKVKQLRREA